MPTIACPYCNAAVPVPPAGRRTPCPRCGETVTVPAEAQNGAAAAELPAPAAPPGAVRPSNWSVARVVLTGMLLMAAITLVYALATVPRRRANDTPDAQPPGPTAETRPLPLAEWPGLGYLPDDTHALAGVRLAAALESTAGRALLVPLGLAPDAAGRPATFGLVPTDVEHLVFGASLRAFPPRMTTVIRTRRPVSVDRVRTALQAGRPTDHNGKELLRGKLWAGGPDGAVWLPGRPGDDRTLIAALLPDDFDKLPPAPRPDAGRFAAPLPELLTRRLDPSALIWLAAATGADNPTLAVLAGLLTLPPADRDAWGQLDSLALSVRADGGKFALMIWLRGHDAAVTGALADAVAKSLTAAGVAVERAADGDGVRLTATANGAKLTGWVEQLRGKPK
jgi:hypothetical protein